MKALMKRVVAHTPLAPVARSLYQRMLPEAGASRDDRLAFKIMAEVLDRDSNCVDVG